MWVKFKSTCNFFANFELFLKTAQILLILCKFLKKPKNWKKHSFTIFSIPLSSGKFFQIWFEFFLSYLSRKKGNTRNISQSWPDDFSVSAYSLDLKNATSPSKTLFVGSLFSPSITWEKPKLDMESFPSAMSWKKSKQSTIFFSGTTLYSSQNHRRKCLQHILNSSTICYNDSRRSYVSTFF